MSRTPRSLKEIVLADLERGQRLRRKAGDEIDPQFRIATPEGDWWIAMTLPPGIPERLHQFKLLSMLIAWKMALGFTMTVELNEPWAICCYGATHKEQWAFLSRIVSANPLRFDKPERLPPEAVGGEVAELLPRGDLTLDDAAIAELERTFGAKGTFPAVNLVTGKLGL